MPKNLIFGVGINDADYHVAKRVNGVQVNCEFYVAWHGMLKRCYSAKYQEKRPTYIGCSVESSWLTFSNFKRWMEKQDWQGKALDKDILKIGNRHYSESLCAFVDSATNNFVSIKMPIDQVGFTWIELVGKFQSQCKNPITGKCEFLGYFKEKEQANFAWRKRKHELACQLADLQTDERVANALRTRYL